MKQTLYDYCMETGREALLREWDSEKNLPLTPEAVTSGSSRYAFWRCERGHTWRATIYSRSKKDSRCPYCSGVRVERGVNDLATLAPQLVCQWHPTKNGALTPDQVITGSHRVVWWRCEKGHEWKAQIKSRTSGCGCPVCAGRLLLPGVNDLASQFPDLAAQWHPTRNGVLRPEDVLAGSHWKVWWRCERGHEWKSQILSRTQSNCGCPVCAGKAVVAGDNDLATVAPEIAAEWDREKNGVLSPQEVTPSSNRSVWWLCPLGHSYRATVAARTCQQSGCPVCAGRKVLPGFNDLATLEPEIAAQWHPTLNGMLKPTMVTPGSHKKVWWECPEGHVWKAVVYSRGSQKTGCPICAGKVKRPRPQRAAARKT